MHSLPFIKELESIPEIRSIQDIISINNFVFSLIPWTKKPYGKNLSCVDIQELYEKLKGKEIGGWCYMCADFLRILMGKYNVSARLYDFGLAEYQLTHAVTIITHDQTEFIFDPYFARYYIFDGKILQFEKLFNLIRTQQFESIVSVYGDGIVKPIECADGWEFWTPLKLEESVMERFKAMGYEKVMQEKFNSQKFENLFQKQV